MVLWNFNSSTQDSLPRIPTFLCSLKVKGTVNRVVGAKSHEPCGPRDKFSTFFKRSHFHQLVDYYSTRSSDGTSSLSPKEGFFSSIRRRIIRLLWYSISGWDTLPISQEDFSHLQDDELFDYFGTRPMDGTCSLSPKRISSSMRWQLIDYLGTRF